MPDLLLFKQNYNPTFYISAKFNSSTFVAKSFKVVEQHKLPRMAVICYN